MLIKSVASLLQIATFSVVWWRELYEVENECTSHNFSLFAIFLPKLSNLVEIWWSSDKNSYAQFYLRHGVINAGIRWVAGTINCSLACVSVNGQVPVVYTTHCQWPSNHANRRATVRCIPERFGYECIQKRCIRLLPSYIFTLRLCFCLFILLAVKWLIMPSPEAFCSLAVRASMHDRILKLYHEPLKGISPNLRLGYSWEQRWIN